VALLQYFLSGTFAYLSITDAKGHADIPVDLFGLRFPLTLWITVAPLAYALINFHMCRLMRQMARLLRRDRKNAASMAIMAVQSPWFGNPFHTSVKSNISYISMSYIVICGVIPFMFMAFVANEVYIKSEHTTMETILSSICNLAFAGSVFLLME